MASVVSSALAGGVNMIQLREKDLPACDLLAMAKELRVLTDRRALLLINDRVDVALAVNADGIQLGENGLPVGEVHRLSNDKFIIGRSIHDVNGAVEAQARGADFLISGTIFPSQSHSNYEASGLKLLQDLRTLVRIPYLAIGGITSQNIAMTVNAGASGAAMISAISESIDVESEARAVVNAINWARCHPTELG